MLPHCQRKQIIRKLLKNCVLDNVHRTNLKISIIDKSEMYLSLPSLARRLSSSNVSSIPHGFPLSFNSPNRRGLVWYVLESFCSVSFRLLKQKANLQTQWLPTSTDTSDESHLWALLWGPGWQTHILRKALRVLGPKLRPEKSLRVCITGVATGCHIPVGCLDQ